MEPNTQQNQDDTALNTLINSSGDNDEPGYDPAIVEAARKQGWKPKEQFDGPEEEWVPPDVFNDRAVQINPILRAKNQRLEKALERERQERLALEERFNRSQQASVAQTRKEIENGIAALRQKRIEAISSGDGQAVDALDEQIDTEKGRLAQFTVEPTKPAGPASPPPEMVAGMQNFVAQFPWFGKDNRKSNIAVGISNTVMQEHPELVGKPEFFDFLAKEVRAHFRETDTRGSIVEGGGNGSSRFVGGKTFNSMPREAQEACDRDVARGLFKDRAEYVAMYFEQGDDR